MSRINCACEARDTTVTATLSLSCVHVRERLFEHACAHKRERQTETERQTVCTWERLCVHVSSCCVHVSEQALICVHECVCAAQTHTQPPKPTTALYSHLWKTRLHSFRFPPAIRLLKNQSQAAEWHPIAPPPKPKPHPAGETKLTQLPASLYNTPFSCLPLLTPPPPGAVADVSGPRPMGTGGGWGELPGLCCMSGLTTPALSSRATAKITDNEGHSGSSSQCRSRLRFAWSSSGRLR